MPSKIVLRVHGMSGNLMALKRTRVETHVVNESDALAELLITVHAGKPEQVGDLLVLVPERVRAKLFRAKIAAEVLLALECLNGKCESELLHHLCRGRCHCCRRCHCIVIVAALFSHQH